MLNVLTKSTPWVVATVVAATSLFGQDNRRPQRCFEQNQDKAQMMPAYNAPARIDVRGAWDFFVTGSFIYWQPSQDNMELGVVQGASNNNVIPVTGANATSTRIVTMNFDFLPGFKVALGMNFDHDNWNAYAEWTRLHGSSTTTSTSKILPFLFSVDTLVATTPDFVADSIRSNWRNDLDFLDLVMGRPYYVGTALTFHPFFGARAAWIDQSLHYQAIADQTPFTTTNVLHLTHTSTSWAIGTRAGLDTNWLIGKGFRLYGNAAGDILYTRYDNIRHQEVLEIPSTNTTTVQYNVNEAKLGVLRPHMEMEMGIGYGSYFDNNNWHIDLIAGYTFQVFWDQNMFRYFIDDIISGSSFNFANDLFIQGLTVTARLDF